MEKLREHEKKRDFFCVVSDAFRVFARRSSTILGSAWAFAGALFVILVWGLTGPTFHFSDTWQLIINTGTTIVTFLMVFLIQNTQNRDAKAMHLKLNELISSLKAAHNEMIDIENLTDKQLEEIAQFYRKKKEECADDTIAAITTDAAEHTAHDTAERVAGDTAKRVVEDKRQRVA